jgi:hypothetical protein
MIKNNEVATINEVTVKSFDYSGAKFTAMPNGWRQYGLIDLLTHGGSLITEGSFTKVQIWMEPTVVKYSPEPSAFVTLPGPDPVTDPKSTFTYPTAPQFSLVAVQCLDGVPVSGTKAKVNYTPILISATSERDCQTIHLDNSNKNLFIAFNDKVDAYYDNSGDVSIMVKLIK